MSDSKQKNKLIIGITTGDLNGIGLEVIIKSLEDTRITKQFTPVIYGSSKSLSFYRKLLQKESFNYQQIKSLDQAHDNKINLLNIWNEEVEITPGKPSSVGGKYAKVSLVSAVKDLKEGRIQAVTTAPLSKELVQDDEFRFPGHTEYLTQEVKAKDSLMFMVHDTLKVGVATGHIPLKEVSEKLTEETLKSKLEIMIKSLKYDFAIKKPKIAVLGPNPHAGENGLLGNEEADVLTPVMDQLRREQHLVFGPFPADGFFGMSQYKNYDAVLAMYHDQGLIPFKTIAFEEGVNFTAGLPFVRTSPDHGTAFSLAGRNEADPTSFRSALYMANDIVRRRNLNEFE